MSHTESSLMRLALSWRRPLSYRNQSIDLFRKSMDWFLHGKCLRHERVKQRRFDKVLLHYQGKFNNILDELKNHLNELKTKFCKLESDLHISRNVNDKLLIVLEVLDTIDATVNTDLVKDCPGIPSKGSPQKVILKLSRRKYSRQVLLNKK